MYLDHIIAHETYHFFHALPLNLLPHVSSNNVGYLELKKFSAIFSFGLPTEMFGIWGLVIYHWKALENTFIAVYYMPQNFKRILLQNEKERRVVV